MSFVLDGKAKTHTLYRKIIENHKDIHHEGRTEFATKSDEMINLSRDLNYSMFALLIIQIIFVVVVVRIQGRH